jgi:ABC-2 type transport system permease protein
VIGVSVLPADPDNSLVAVLSVIPLFAPLLMPMRLAMGGVPVTEVVLALMLTVVLIVGLVRLAGRVYASAVMHTGGRVRVLEALRVSS